MPKSIFISYVYEDRKCCDDVARWVSKGLLGPNVVSVVEQDDVRQQGEAAVERYLKPKIRGAAAVVCLVGQNTHNHNWVKYELDVATSLGKNIILLRIPNTMGAKPPGHGHLEIHAFDPSTLKNLI
jgi:hypothetical protein